jgi:hypothetical protein
MVRRRAGWMLSDLAPGPVGVCSLTILGLLLKTARAHPAEVRVPVALPGSAGSWWQGGERVPGRSDAGCITGRRRPRPRLR